MIANWEKNWSFSTAVKRWAIDPALFVSVDNAESCLPQVFDDAFAGRFGRLHEREDLKPLAAVLPNVLESLRQKMNALELAKDAKLPPVLWLRLMREAGVKPVDTTVREFEWWQEQMRVNGLTILYRRRERATKNYVGPSRKRDGLGKVIGFTVEELLNEQRAATRNWPYHYRWKCVTESAKVSPKLPLLFEKTPTKPKKSVTVELPNESRNVAPLRKRTKRTKRSRQSIERTCGKPLIDVLEKCLETEHARKSSVLELKGRNRRPYKSQLSLDKLVDALKQRYLKHLTCTDSTLKRALPYFVACPRGRPGGMN